MKPKLKIHLMAILASACLSTPACKDDKPAKKAPEERKLPAELAELPQDLWLGVVAGWKRSPLNQSVLVDGKRVSFSLEAPPHHETESVPGGISLHLRGGTSGHLPSFHIEPAFRADLSATRQMFEKSGHRVLLTVGDGVRYTLVTETNRQSTIVLAARGPLQCRALLDSKASQAALGYMRAVCESLQIGAAASPR